MNETTKPDPKIAVVEHAGSWGACYTDGLGAHLIVAGAKTAAGAVLGAASKLATNVHAGRGSNQPVDPALLAVAYPASVGPLGLDDHSNERLQERLARYGVSLTPSDDIDPLDPNEFDEAEVDVFGIVKLDASQARANRELIHRERAHDLGAVAYWTAVSVRGHDTPGNGGVGYGAWAWVREDGETMSGHLMGSSATLQLRAIDEVYADANRNATIAVAVSCEGHLGSSHGLPTPRDGHYLQTTAGNSTPAGMLASALAAAAARDFEAVATSA